MSHPSASADPLAPFGPRRMIALFLERLVSCLVRLQASGKTVVPSDIAQMAASADGLVHAFVRMLAAAQLENAGYKKIAHDMRTPVGTSQAATAPTAPETVSPTELLTRLSGTLEQFEQADALASTLACAILCALAVVSPETHSATAFAQPESCNVSGVNRQTGHTAPPWPPPLCLTSLTPVRNTAFIHPPC